MSTQNNGSMWSQAALKGLLLALVTVACNTVTYLVPGNGFVSILMFLVRTAASIWLLVSFMKQYHAATGQNPFNFGLAVVLFSSFICAFYDAAALAWIFPGLMDQVNEAMAQSMSMFPSSQQGILDNMMEHYPRIAFFSTLIKDFLFGLIVAAIANSSYKSKSPFDGDSQEDELA
ncbi:MAG: DUF4199 domain-containing protein [Bacteroidales bacterium]|nr:DUF4199 domain-containing protein [Bacteroidales bacterium]